MDKVTAIILAAGESKRMGQPKMLMPFRGMTVIETVIENLIGTDVNGLLLVTGAENEKIIHATGRYPVQYCFNEDYKEGMLSSVKCGFRNLPEDSDFALVCLGDQPMVKAEVINRLIKGAVLSGKGLAMPVYDGRRGHPLLVSCRYKDQVLNLESADGLRSLVSANNDDTEEVKIEDPSVLRDLDTYEDYLNEINQNP